MTNFVVQLCIGSRTKVSKVFWVRSVGSVGFGVAWVGRVPGRLRDDVVDVLLFGFWWASGFKGARLLIFTGLHLAAADLKISENRAAERYTGRRAAHICLNIVFEGSASAGIPQSIGQATKI